MLFLSKQMLTSFFDGGYGSAYLAKMVGQKKAREIFFFRAEYSAQDAMDMGMVNAVIPHAELEDTAYEWAQEILGKSLWLSKC
jgi:naphthoate synthase